MRCERTGGCPIFARFSRISELDALLSVYCLHDPSGCVRLAMVRRGERPPDDLMPDGTRRELAPRGQPGRGGGRAG